MADKVHRIALIGAGQLANLHAKAWTAAGHEIFAVSDVDAARADALANEYGAERVYYEQDGYKRALNDASVDIVDVCVPLELHAPITIEAAEAGKHVFCEKPIARTLEEARAMEHACRTHGVQFGLGFQRNLAAGVDFLRKLADDGAFGRPRVFNADLLQEVRPKRFMHDRRSNNGPIVDACCHYFLLWQSVFRSKPKTVFARGGIFGQDRPEIAHIEELAIDTAVITVEYETGDMGTMTVSWGLDKNWKMNGREDRVFGPRGGAEATGMADFQWTGFNVYRNGAVEYHEMPRKDLFLEQVELFVSSVEGRREQPAYSFLTGKQMLALSLAILQSIDTGEVTAVHYDM